LRDKLRATHILIKEHLVNKKPLDHKKLLSNANEILTPLRIVRDSLNQNQSENIAEGDLLDLIRRARCFGINLAKLDIRQESSRHTKLISEIIKKKYNKDYLSWNESEKLAFLSSKIKSKKNLIKNSLLKNKENKEVWSTFNVLVDQPKECLGAYVISMTSAASDILSVAYLQKEAKIINKLRVVPLFETLDDLKNAKSIMKSLFSLSWYRKSINYPLVGISINYKMKS
jgi:phosphoenolpyruvate carboxylase